MLFHILIHNYINCTFFVQHFCHGQNGAFVLRLVEVVAGKGAEDVIESFVRGLQYSTWHVTDRAVLIPCLVCL